jgi:hypothetical protein
MWRADVQRSQAQQRRTAFSGRQTHLGAPLSKLRGRIARITVRSVL